MTKADGGSVWELVYGGKVYQVYPTRKIAEAYQEHFGMGGEVRERKVSHEVKVVRAK